MESLTIVGGGIFLSVGSFLISMYLGLLVKYPDAQAHLLIARRVCDSSSVGLAQLGAVWLPLTHILSLPLICSDVVMKTEIGAIITAFLLTGGMLISISKFTSGIRNWSFRALVRIIGIAFGLAFVLVALLPLNTNVFYTTGLAQSVISMISYVLLGFFLYRFTIELANGDKGAGVIAWLVFMTNVNVLYLQGTAMTELPLYFGITVSVYTFWKLSHDPSSFKWIGWNGVANFIMTMIRYEGWAILLLEAVIYFYILLRSRLSFPSIRGHVVMWGFLAFSGVAGWLTWNQTIFGTPFEFQTGIYSKPSNWVAGNEPVIGNLKVSFMTYSWGVWDTIGPIVLIGVVALLVYLVATKFRKDSFAPLMPLILFPFFVYMLYKGQRPMQITEVEGSIYNARFALVILLSVAPLIGFMTRKRMWVKRLIFVVLVFATTYTWYSSGVVTLNEPLLAEKANFSREQQDAAAWFAKNYDGTKVLMESYGNEQLQFGSQVDLGNITYEGTYQKWDVTLSDPVGNGVYWVVMRKDQFNSFQLSIPAQQGDLVMRTLGEQPDFLLSYKRVYENPLYLIYYRSAG